MPGRVESWTTMRATPSEEARMRGEGTGSEPHMWSYVPLERRIPSDHPLRSLRAMVDTILGELSPQFDQLYSQVEQRGLLSDEHFTVDGTLIDAWASLKSFQRKDAPPTTPDDPGNPTVNFHGERRRNATHASTTDPQALLYRKGARREAKLCYQGHVLMENRHGLAVDGCLTPANGYGERAAALEMVGPVAMTRRITLAADKAYDTRDFVGALRLLQVTPHVAQNTSNRSSAIDRRTTRHAGYEVSQQKRKRIEEVFGWLKTIGLLRQTRHRGRRRVGWMFVFSLAVYNLVRIRNLAECPA